MTLINVTMGLSRTVSEIEGDFSRKWQQQNPTSLYFAPAELGTGAGVKKN